MDEDTYGVDPTNVVVKYRQRLTEVQDQLMIAQAAVDELLAKQAQLIDTVRTQQAEGERMTAEISQWRDKALMVDEIRGQIDELVEGTQPVEGTD